MVQDRIEEEAEPQAHLEPNADAEEVSRQMRRVKIFDADVQAHGYTDGCLRCQYL